MKKGTLILVWILAVTVIAYVVGVAVWSAKRMNEHLCGELDITITDIDERQYVTEAEIVALLKQKRLYPVGKPAAKVQVQQIEDEVTLHPMVQAAECYILSSGTVCIRLSQRIPVMRVLTGTESYFVDSKRQRMPIRESVTTPVMLATGNIGERMACNELADLAVWLQNSSYWRTRVQYIQVANPRYVYLVQQPDGTKLILGEVNGYARKLRKLRKLYDNVFDEIGWQTYEEIDLRFNGQIVGRH